MFPVVGMYALRTMVIVAEVGGQVDAVPSKVLAPRAKVPRAYLSKVLRQLVVAGLLHSRTGHYGGFTLAKPAKKIRLKEIFNAVNAMPAREICAFGWDQCDRRLLCPLHDTWSEVTDNVIEWATKTRLADLSGLDSICPPFEVEE